MAACANEATKARQTTACAFALAACSHCLSLYTVLKWKRCISLIQKSQDIQSSKITNHLQEFKRESVSLLVALFALLSFYLIRHKNDHIVRFRCKPILSLLHHLPHFALPGRFGQSLNLLNRDSMASGGSGIKKEWGGGGLFFFHYPHAEHLYERHRLMVGGVLGRG